MTEFKREKEKRNEIQPSQQELRRKGGGQAALKGGHVPVRDGGEGTRVPKASDLPACSPLIPSLQLPPSSDTTFETQYISLPTKGRLSST